MASISQNEFMQMQKERAERAAAPRRQERPRVGYFSLKDDGDECVVRFAYSTPEELELFTTHSVTIDGRFRRVNCLRSFKDPIEMCPMCASGNNFQNRTYIKLIQYDRDENGNIVATPKIWERPSSYVQTLNNLFAEYGNISDYVFKVKRSGEKGSMQTTYNIMFCNPTIYNSQLYPKDFSAFEGYNVLGGPLMDKSFSELKEMLGEAQEVERPQAPTPVQQHQTFTPQYAQAEPQRAPWEAPGYQQPTTIEVTYQ